MHQIIYKSPQGCTETYSYETLSSLVDQKTQTFLNMPKHMLYVALYRAFSQAIVPVLYDKNIQSIKPRVDKLNVELLPKDTSIIFFTSGTTGEPTGALKSKQNILKELKTLTDLFAPHHFERVIVTVPLIHIYGFLAGVLLPQALGAEVILKEEFMPHELLELAEDKNTICITNPVFLKVLNKLNIEKQYKNITFLSSTGKLESEIAKALNQKIGSTIYQLFGSTETGGIAYKINEEVLWRPLEGVQITSDNTHLAIESPYISEYLIEDGLKKIQTPFVTTDIIEIQKDGFKLLGRESEIIKISGKRISLLEVEYLLEKSELIEDILVKLAYNMDTNKEEQLELFFVSKDASLKEIKQEFKRILQENYTHMNIKTIMHKVEKIPRNHLGKKIRK